MRWLLALSFLFLSSACTCEEPAAPDAGVAVAPEAPPPPDPRVDALREWLRAQAVTHTHVGRSVMYAWTSETELEALRAGAPLLTASVEGERRALDVGLVGDASGLVERMRRPGLSRRRTAWPSPWAIRSVGAGDRLLRFELAAEALIAVYDSRITPRVVRFFTDEGNDVPLAEALQVPQFWAVVCHVYEQPGADGAAMPSREMVLVNESMIARVSYGTPEITAELEVERERLSLFASQLSETAAPFTQLSTSWEALPPEDATLLRLYEATLAVGSPPYGPTEANVRAIVRGLPQQPGPAFVREPSVAFELGTAAAE